MTNTSYHFNALIMIDPEKAKEEICKALRSAGMHKGNAAKEMGCSHGTLLRWIERLSLDTTIEKMMKQAQQKGWRFNGRTGRPRKTKTKTRSKRASASAS